ncbi:MAG: rhomboid family intramembrane serine protease [Phycisphaeraceae bacterium]|nr:rhomboid family intramembrane serine protease [Phycisphaeraceae bacterium]MCW5762179.1 rhomboid family intramembrane serine protease [Phycisphaeraceae bacterium]
MGIYDRDYVRDQRAGAGAPGRERGTLARRARGFSFTTWLIAINIAVAIIRLALGSFGHPVHVQTELTVDPATITQLRESQDYFVSWAPPNTTNPGRTSGTLLYRTLFDVASDGSIRPVGKADYKVMDPLERFGHFSTATGFARLEVWRLVTFQFLHAGFMHLLFNMFGLWVFGRIVEEQLGGKRYLAFYLTCGIFGGLLYLVLNLAGVLGLRLPGALNVQITTSLVGASAGVFGVLMACAYIAPKTIVQLIFPPIPIQMRYLVYGFFALSVWNLVIGSKNQGGEAAHVGGALAGYFFIRRAYLLNDFFEVFRRSSKPRKSPKPSRARTHASDAEIDTILDKISRDGIAGLSDEERKRLAEHSKSERQDRSH